MGFSDCGVIRVAKIEFDGLAEYMAKLAEIGANIEGTIKQAVYPAAGMVIEEIKRSCPVDSGDLRDSMALVRFENENGYVYTKVVFDGYDSKGVPNALKANVLESGSSTRRKHPFIRPAVNRIKAAATAEIERQLNDIITRKMEG